MNRQLTTVLEHIKNQYKENAMAGGRHYLNVDIGDMGRKLGFQNISDHYANREVVVSLKTPLPGMKVRIDGRTFVNYAEYAEGFSVPKNIAEKAGIPFKEFMAMDSMILNFT